MTLASVSRPKRETSVVYRSRPLIVEVGPFEAVLREKGRRDKVTVPWEAVYHLGFKLRRIEEQRNRKKGR